MDKEIKLIRTERALSPTQVSLAPFVINPYRGCTVGCSYCYAKNNKIFNGKKDRWGSFLDVKENIAEVLKEELKKNHPHRVLIGSVCEPFNEEEETYNLTRQILNILKDEGIACTILTRSVRIKKYLDIINYHPGNKVYFTVNFLDTDTKKKFEPHIDYTTEDIVDLFKMLKKNKIRFRAHISPLVPFIMELDQIIKEFAPFTEEFFVEGYNSVMGSWDMIKKIIKAEFPHYAEDIILIFDREHRYNNYITSVKLKLHILAHVFKKDIMSFFPPYGKFYTEDIVYE